MSASPRLSTSLRFATVTVLALAAGCTTGSAPSPGGPPSPGNAPSPPPIALPPPAGAQEVHDCDTYAAHPDDVGRWATGVLDTALAPGLALQRCSIAVSDSPQTPRFHFQLGRVLWQLDRKADALTAFKRAAELGNCPAKYYLGEAALGDARNGKLERGDEAWALFEEAEKCNFAPASRRLNELGFTSAGFEAPNVIKALLNKDIATLNTARLTVAWYLMGVQEYMSMDFHPVSQECPALVARAAVSYELEAAASGDSELASFSVRSFQTILSMSPAPVRALIEPVYAADPDKFKGYFRELGKRDAIDLIERLGGIHGGCTSQVTRDIYGQIIEFAKAKRPLGEYWREVLSNTIQVFGGLGIKHATASPDP